MEITKEYLIQKAREFRAMSEQLKNQSIAHGAAAEAMEQLVIEMDKPTPPAPPIEPKKEG